LRISGSSLDHHQKKPVDLIAEEWGQAPKRNFPTVASLLAPSIGAERHNMEMSDDLMKEKGIFLRVKDRRDNGPQDKYLQHEDPIREYHWLSEIQSRAPKRGVIALCGMIHAAPFSEKLRDAGFTVTTKTLKEWQWYNEWQAERERAYNQALLQR
jgi:hypothetical protein